MILADTSLWVEFFRGRRIAAFAALLEQDSIIIHSVVVGELATGNLHSRAATLAMLHALPRAASARTHECLAFIEVHKLYGRGVGWMDVQLLATARLSHHQIWSLDEPLMQAAAELRLAYYPD